MADFVKIKKQIEFYFSDSNFPKDRFLRAQSALNENGFVNLEIIASFKRMKELTTDLKLIADAVADSDVVELNSERTMIKRKQPIPLEDKTANRLLYIKRWPEGTTMDEIEHFLSTFGRVLCVRQRKDKKK